MMTLDKDGNFKPWRQPQYGQDARDCDVTPPDGYEIVPRNEALRAGDVPFDVYSGWIAPMKAPRRPDACKYPDLRYNNCAWSNGRWTAWARPNVVIFDSLTNSATK